MTAESEVPFFRFDDGSVLSLDQDPSVQQVYGRAFRSLPDLGARRLVVGAVDYFWSARRVPDRHGQEWAWPEAFPDKAALADAVLRGLLGSQMTAHHVGVEKFFLVELQPSDVPARTEGSNAVQLADRLTRSMLLDFGVRGIGQAAFGAYGRRRFDDALKEFRVWTEIQPDSGEAWYWTGIAAAKAGRLDEARAIFRKGAELLKSPYLDRVACPKCSWIPVGQAAWQCEKCHGNLDTFRTRAKCPWCVNSWERTSCIACGVSSPHRDWWLPVTPR